MKNEVPILKQGNNSNLHAELTDIKEDLRDLKILTNNSISLPKNLPPNDSQPTAGINLSQPSLPSTRLSSIANKTLHNISVPPQISRDALTFASVLSSPRSKRSEPTRNSSSAPSIGATPQPRDNEWIRVENKKNKRPGITGSKKTSAISF